MATKMTREDAIKILMGYSHTPQERAALEVLIPELAESEDERIRKGLVKLLTVASEAYVVNSTGIKKDSYLTYLEKQQESLHIPETSKENANSFTDEDERIRRWLCDYFSSIDNAWIHKDITCIDILKWLEKQKEQNLIMANSPQLKEQKPAEKHDLVTQLKEHFANTPKEQLEAEWKELEHWNNIGPTVEEYFHRIKPADWSEDERMLREIKRYIKEQGDKPTGLPNGTVAISDMIAWLEKQKEHNPSFID